MSEVRIAKNKEEQIEFWGNVPFVLLHLGCLLVFWTGVSTAALWVCFLSLAVRMFGLTAGYHRYFSHRSFKTSRIFQYILALLGAASLQKDPLWWAAHHREHHRYTDTERDAHSPTIHGFFWSHMGWVMCKKNANLNPDVLVPDLVKFPELKYLNRNQKVPALAFLALLTVLGAVIQYAFPQLETTIGQTIVWGFFISTIVLHHCTFLVNSAAHLWGTRDFKTKDTSRNNWVVAFLTMGEGWHNNHHRFPFSEKHGLKWWQLDVTHYILVFLSWFGIVWDLKAANPKELEKQTV